MPFLSTWWFEVVVIAATFALSLLAYQLQWRTVSNASTPKPFPRLIAQSVFPYVAIFLSVTTLAAYVSCKRPEFLPDLLREYLNPICGCEDLAAGEIVKNAAILLGVDSLLVQLAHSGFAPVLVVLNFVKSERGHRRANPLSALAMHMDLFACPQTEFEECAWRTLGGTDERYDFAIWSVQTRRLYCP